MARVTVEDCLENLENRFHLVLVATARARQLAMGTAEATVPWENDKPTVVALREIANGLLKTKIDLTLKLEDKAKKIGEDENN